MKMQQRNYYRTSGNFGDSPQANPLPQAIQGQDPGSGGLATAIANPLGDILDPQVDGSDYFFYGTNVASIASQVTSNSQIQVDAGTDFLWIATTYMVDIGAAQTTSSQVIPQLTVTILDTGATKNLMNTPVPINTIASNNPGLLYRLIRPRLFRANSVINFTWFNYSSGGGAQTYTNLYCIFHGIRKIQGSFNIA
jgi:hypothetical protein